jgi:hypothetical protein
MVLGVEVNDENMLDIGVADDVSVCLFAAKDGVGKDVCEEQCVTLEDNDDLLVHVTVIEESREREKTGVLEKDGGIGDKDGREDRLGETVTAKLPVPPKTSGPENEIDGDVVKVENREAVEQSVGN